MSGPWEDFAPQDDGPWSDFVKPQAAAPQEAAPTPVGSNWQNFAAGMGQQLANMGRGALQMAAPFGDAIAQARASQQGVPYQPGSAQGVVQQMVDDAKAIDAPLMDTKMGKAGALTMGVASTIPVAMLPGMNTVAGAGLAGGAFGALQPADSQTDRLKNVAVGGAFGAGGQYVGGKIAGAVDDKLAQRAASKAAEKSINAPRDAVLAEAKQAGYVVPPTAVKPNMVNTALESISGKAATRQAAASKNAVVTNRLVKGDLGIAEDAPITREALQAVRTEAGKAYKAIKEVGEIAADGQYVDDLKSVLQAGTDLENAYPGIGAQANQEVRSLVESVFKDKQDSASMVELSKFLRNRAKSNFQSAWSKGGDPQVLELARAQAKVADSVENLISRHLANTGDTAKAQAWDAARTTIAKAYQAEAALKGGNVSARKLAAQLAKGKPVTGGMGTAARFAEHFDDVAMLPKSGAGVSKLAATLAAAGVPTAAVFGGAPGAAAALAATAAPYAVRQGMLSGAGQGLLAVPKYAPGLLGTGLLNAAGTAGKFGALPSAVYATQQ